MKYIYSAFIVLFALASCKNGADSTSANVDFSNIEVADAKKILQNKASIFIDVRTPGEISNGKIEGALEIDFRNSDFESKIAELDKTKSYVVYCKSGGRSAKASKHMMKTGFKDVANMKGGFTAWVEK